MTVPQEKREALLAAIMGGASMRKACRDLHICRSEVFVDLAADDVFADQYARAMAIRADDMFDEMVEIADTPMIGEKTKTLADGKVEISTADMTEHRRLRVDTRKWALARMNPRKYGDKVQVGGADDLPPVATVDATRLSLQALREIMAATDAAASPDEG